MKQLFSFLVCILIGTSGLQAQTDFTSSITNPSFEKGMNGWTYKSLGIQTNSVFTLKDGQNYIEKWTGRGGAVGSASVSQQLRGLPPGNYELSVAAQNIQEDTPKAAQTGAWLFADDNKTKVTVRDNYTVSFDYISGVVTIGFEAVNASGNWIALDNFRLTQTGTDLSKHLGEAIAAAEALYGDGKGEKADQLQAAIHVARTIAADTSATAEQQANAIIALSEATDIYLRANASAEQPLDVTSSIVNPSFETGDLTGWTTNGMGLQGNNVFSIKDGTYYVERWTGRGSAVGDARIGQKISELAAGRYRLKAVAQNIQEDTPKQAQTGAWIFAGSHTTPVTIRDHYVLEFVQVADVLEIGFKAEGATGNWLAADNFQLEYIGDSFAEVKAEFADIIARAQTLVALRMNADAKQTLSDAITASLAIYETADQADSKLSASATTLESAIETAAISQAVFARLTAAIATAKAELANAEAAQTADYQQAIDAAQAVYDAPATTDAQAESAIETLEKASFEFKIANGSGTAPRVVTDKRFIRGCTWAFGRSTVQGTDILEEGFCWSESPEPKVTDQRTTEYLNQAGKIYWLRDLKPATVYYMRAYAINKDYAVGYGDVIKFVTVPKGTVGHWYNNGGDEATNDRINYAIDLSMDYYWNNLTSIHGFGITVNYSPGTPTADCSYGGWMRVGESSSYQQPGTIMHEALHGIGVGTHDIWWNGEMRSAGDRGDWLGDRVTEAVRFWDNSTTAVISGDNMHLWPYGCNGAHEDTHSDNLYCMMGILAQALNEDGLPGSGEIGYALPYYSFNHEDGVKYYLKNENKERGLYSAYLVENASNQLEWKTLSTEEAIGDDHAAWYLTFTPGNQYYQLKNAATGNYMTYASGIKTAKRSKPTTADNFHLMRGRVDVEGHRGYYIIHPQSSANPPLLNALGNGKTGTANFNIAKSATTQRWLILTAEEATAFESGTINYSKKELEDLLAQIRKLAATPHTETAEGTDQTLTTQLASIEAQGKATTSVSELSSLLQQAREAGMAFLCNVSASDVSQPFDLTFMLQNPDFANDATSGWTSSKTPGYGGGAAEFYETTFDFSQTLTGMPSGIYQLRANAFQRPGESAAVFTQYKNGKPNVSTVLYIGTTTETVKHICDDRQPNALYTGDGADKKLSDGTYVPITMNGAAAYFAKGLYDSSVTAEQTTANASMKMGIRGTKTASYYWSIFDNFRLLFFGQNRSLLGVEQPAIVQRQQDESTVVYDLQGRRIQRSTFNIQHSTLRKGLYIVDGKKVIK